LPGNLSYKFTAELLGSRAKLEKCRSGEPVRKQRVVGTIILVMSSIGLFFSIRTMQDEAQGPRPITEAELLKLGDGAEQPKGLVAFDARSLKDTGITKSNRHGLIGRYMLVSFGNRWALAIIPRNHSGNRLIGYIERLDGLGGPDYSAREKVIQKYPNQPLAPFFFQVNDGRKTAWVMFIPSGCFFLLGVYHLLSRRRLNRGADLSRVATTLSAAFVAPGHTPRLDIPKSRHVVTWRSLLLKAKGPTWFLTGFACLCLGFFVLLVVLSASYSHHFLVEFYYILIAAGGFALWAYLTGRSSIMEIIVSDEGLILSRSRRTTQRAWGEIELIYRTEILYLGQRRAACQIVFADGRDLELDTSLSGYDEFLRSVQRADMALRLPALRRSLAAGDEVSFGPVRLWSVGIKISRFGTTWGDVERIYIRNGHLVIQLRSTKTCKCPLRNIPNYSILLNLINDKVGKQLVR
jgi:hypothetical protein